MASLRVLTKKSVQSVFSYGLIKASSLLKISYIVGSQTALFSASSIAVPVLGAFTGSLGAILTFLCGYGLRVIVSGGFGLSYLAYHVPGLCAALYWNSNSAFIRLIVPIACMTLFIVHPVGGQAYQYALYWLIPVALYLFPQKTLFWQALGSTFIAHAVGSVIWLYSVPVTAEQWLGLIPVVIVERMVFAAGMVVAYMGIEYGLKSKEYLYACSRYILNTLYSMKTR